MILVSGIQPVYNIAANIQQ